MADTKIEWADKVWNPVRGCTRVSEGCRNCYAERQALRQAAPGGKYHGLVQWIGPQHGGHPQWTGEIACDDGKLSEPMCWKKPARIFVNSMSDLFHPGVPDDFIDRVWAVMTLAHQHQFLILTKRPERMRQCVSNYGGPLENVWLGVSAENQATADERIPALLTTPAAVRFLSAEPLLGPIDLSAFCRRGLDWVICGGESGPGARPMWLEWLHLLLNDCLDCSIPFFFKQWGEYLPISQFPDSWITERNMRCDEFGNIRVGKKKAGRRLDGREWNEFPQVKK